MPKKMFREQVLQKIQSIPAEQRLRQDKAMLKNLFSHPAFKKSAVVFCFVGVRHEPDTKNILLHSWALGKKVCVPLCVNSKEMQAREIHSLKQLHPSQMGLLEPDETALLVAPSEIDCAIVPCIACTASRHRLGQGKGYYDRFLPMLCENAATLCLCRQAAIVPKLPVEEHDILMDFVISEKGVYPPLGS